MGSDAIILVFRMLSFKPTFSLYSFTSIKRLFNSSLSAIKVVSSAYLCIREKNLPPQNIFGMQIFPKTTRKHRRLKKSFCLPLSCSKNLNKGLVFKIELRPEISAKPMGQVWWWELARMSRSESTLRPRFPARPSKHLFTNSSF